MITRQQLEIINRRTLRYPLQIAEKDYFLALALKTIAESSLGAHLIFKGGTAVHHCYVDQYRFSEDLDFSSNQRHILPEEIDAVFASGDQFIIKKKYVSDATIKIEKLEYTGPLIQPNSLKIDIDYFQNVILPPSTMPYKNRWGIDFTVRVMDVREIAAEKIRAMSDRARYRDFYDFYLLLTGHALNLEEVVGYVRQKEVRKPITRANIERNWAIIDTQKAADMSQIYYSRAVSDHDIKTMIERLPFKEI